MDLVIQLACINSFRSGGQLQGILIGWPCALSIPLQLPVPSGLAPAWTPNSGTNAAFTNGASRITYTHATSEYKVTRSNNMARGDIRNEDQLRSAYRTYQRRTHVPFSERDWERRDERDQRKEDNSVQNALHCSCSDWKSSTWLDSVVWITDPTWRRRGKGRSP